MSNFEPYVSPISSALRSASQKIASFLSGVRPATGSVGDIDIDSDEAREKLGDYYEYYRNNFDSNKDVIASIVGRNVIMTPSNAPVVTQLETNPAQGLWKKSFQPVSAQLPAEDVAKIVADVDAITKNNIDGTRLSQIQTQINEAYRLGGGTWSGAANAIGGDKLNALVRERDSLKRSISTTPAQNNNAAVNKPVAAPAQQTQQVPVQQSPVQQTQAARIVTAIIPPEYKAALLDKYGSVPPNFNRALQPKVIGVNQYGQAIPNFGLTLGKIRAQ